jgi:hypothetical protein
MLVLHAAARLLYCHGLVHSDLAWQLSGSPKSRT